MAKIKVYRKDTGEMSWVPAHWMEHPLLSKPFRKTPSQKSRTLAREEQDAAAAELAALEAIHQTSDSSAAEPANTPTHPDDPALAGDDN